MRLKKLLVEEEEDLEYANRTLQEKYKNNFQDLLYRGTDRREENWDFYPILSGRDPLVLDNRIQVLYDFIVEYRNLDVPKRNESKFATSSKSAARNFGRNVLVVFPQEGSNIVSFKKDTAYYRKRLDSALGKISRLDPYTSIIHLHKLSKIRNPEEFGKYLEENWLNIKEEAKKANEENMFASVSSFYTNLRLYFEKMKRGVHSNSNEVIFDGSTYLGFDVDFFERNFKWDGNEWTLK